MAADATSLRSDERPGWRSPRRSSSKTRVSFSLDHRGRSPARHTPGISIRSRRSAGGPSQHAQMTRRRTRGYPAGHPGLNGAAATVLLEQFRRRPQTFTLTTTGQPNRLYTSIARARSDGNNARVWGGMHYPSTVRISDAVGEAIAEYVDMNSMKRLRKGHR